MSGHARRDIVREGEIGTYHTWSRCIQRAHLCGEDPYTGQNFEHRRQWIKSLLVYQASVFAVDVGNYTILSNHQHLIARTRPDIAATWSDEEVAWRWKLAWPSWIDGQWVREPTDEDIEEVLASPERIPKLRANLASLSWFMARWKEPISKMANAESGTKGHFYEQRFGSRELVDDAANLCCHVYLDLNQTKAGLAPSLIESHCSAIQDRMRTWRKREARESVDYFQARVPENYVLPMSDMEQMLADCFLAPISDEGPCLLLGAADAPLKQIPSITTLVLVATDVAASEEPVSEEPEENPPPRESECHNDGAVLPELPSEPAAGVASVACVDSSGTLPSQGCKPVPQRTRHRRLQRTRRSRVSNQPCLGMRRAQYLGIVEWSDAQLRGASREPPPPEWESVLRQSGIEPSRWCDAIEHFGELFHRAAGHIDQIAQRIGRAGQQWFHGSRACRDLFT